MAKILDIIPYKFLPAQLGGQKAIAMFCKYLGEQNELTCISVKSNEKKVAENYELIEIFSDKKLRYLNPFYVKKIKKNVQERKIKIVITEHPYMAWIGYWLQKKIGIKWMIRSHNIEFIRFKTLGKPWFFLLKYYETWAYKKADKVLFITSEDCNYAINNNFVKNENAVLMPFGVELKEMPNDIKEQKKKIYSAYNIPSSCKLIFFNGALSYKPNLDALIFILNKINPLLLQQKNFNYRILICGKDLPASLNKLKNYADKNVIYAGFVDDINSYFKAADIFLNPVVTGGGIKTKVIEALSFGVTVISCKTGAAGINLQACGEKVVLVNDNNATQFVAAIINKSNQLIDTPKSYYDYYYWGNIIKKLQPLFNI